MRVHVADHPLVAHKLTYLRDKRTDTPTFRRLTDELVTLLAYEATREVRVTPFDIETPVAPTTGIHLSSPKPLVVPILRAGLGMLDGMMRMVPTAEVGALPLPTILAVGGALLGLLVAAVARAANRVGARRRAASTRRRLVDATTGVGRELVIAPVDAELATMARLGGLVRELRR